MFQTQLLALSDNLLITLEKPNPNFGSDEC